MAIEIQDDLKTNHDIEELGIIRVVHNGEDADSDPRREIPVLGFRDYWYPVISARKVPRKKPLYLKILGDELCIFHGESNFLMIFIKCNHVCHDFLRSHQCFQGSLGRIDGCFFKVVA